ncbi:hypothetical protein CHS0354_021387 [Potamilus streckersoni]|uniref:Uncharacterized protein n=1 Tax=Potamilus streckersoni TaxID=2493646 RepID=A0AAE0VNY6_9BIVA|nr:hypothetical protein CHS0354_021387 [Potamilus streckersoni]
MHKKMATGILFLLICVVTCSFEYDINDPKTNLDFFVRTVGSRDPKVETVNYLNGSVFAKIPDMPLVKIFNYEGYNINRKIPLANGSYNSLSREFVVYRDPETYDIQRVWINIYTGLANEIFFVANDPVNGHFRLGDIVPTKILPREKIGFNSDIVLEYPNALDPVNYSRYSAGPVYDSVELFEFFVNVTRLASTKDNSVPSAGTWARKSQFLPWMEMSTTPGDLYYTTMFWKCMDGLNCVAKDVLDIIKAEFPIYLKAPSSYEIPNETSWTQFKEVIDKRRKAGLPDIIIPQVNVTQNVTSRETWVDPRILRILTSNSISVHFNGTGMSEIVGKQQINLFNFEGEAFLRVNPPTNPNNSYSATIYAAGVYKDPNNGTTLTNWFNPITGITVEVPPIIIQSLNVGIPREFVYSMGLPSEDSLGLIAAQSNPWGELWDVKLVNLLFGGSDLNMAADDVFFYGTFARFSHWLPWMEMGDVEGKLVLKATVSRNVS